MKKILLTLTTVVIAQFSYAQFTTSSGNTTTSNNVGIGTSSPSTYLTVNSSAGAVTNAIDVVGYSSSVKGHFGSFSNGTYITSNYYYNGGQYNDNSTYGQAAIGLQAGATNTSSINFFLSDAGTANPAAKMTILSSGNVGIGTTNPSALLDVESSTVGVTSLVKSGLNTGYSQFQAQNDNGGNGAFHHAIFGSTYSGTLFGASLANSATLYADGTSISGMLIGTKTATPVTIGTNNAAAITVISGGNVGIGTTTPDTKLAVLGTIHANEVKVDLSVPGPDYVFELNYKLPKLNELKKYLDKNHHLPEIPSADQMAKEGLNLGDMNVKLLKKVEELTLYLIEKDKQDKQKDMQLQIQQEQINQLKEQMTIITKALNQQVKKPDGKTNR